MPDALWRLENLEHMQKAWKESSVYSENELKLQIVNQFGINYIYGDEFAIFDL